MGDGNVFKQSKAIEFGNRLKDQGTKEEKQRKGDRWERQVGAGKGGRETGQKLGTPERNSAGNFQGVRKRSMSNKQEKRSVSLGPPRPLSDVINHFSHNIPGGRC